MVKRRKMMVGALTAMAILFLGIAQTNAATSQRNDSAITQSIKEKQEQINKAQQEKNGLKKNLSNVQQIKKNLESKKNNLNNYIKELDEQIAAVENKVNDLKAQIVEKEAEIVNTQEELENAILREDGQMESMIIRARQMYEKKGSLASELLAGNGGIGDFLNRAEFMEKLVTYDKEQWMDFQNYRKYVQLCEKKLEIEKDILDQTKENVELEQNTLEVFMEQKKQDIESYESDISTQEKAIAEYEAMIKEQDEEIRALEKAIEADKKLLSLKLTYDGGTFLFPLAYYTRVSCDYGWRIHPTLKVKEFHKGIDFASPKGTAIYAAYDGVVVAAAYSASMGNYVMINHGDNLYTVYMHASTLKVSTNAVVKRGDTIALVGTTGRSTGNHLHFSVRKDGEYVSPWDYITTP